jgi:hypothetical protein
MVATLPRDLFWDHPCVKAAFVVCMILLLSLAGCGGGKSAGSLSITCAGGTQLVGAASIDVLGELADGRPKIEFPDPANPGKTGVITVQPRDHCKVSPA